jgi:hypothetical protein
MEATFSSEMSVDFRRISWRYIPEERALLIFPKCMLCGFVYQIGVGSNLMGVKMY